MRVALASEFFRFLSLGLVDEAQRPIGNEKQQQGLRSKC
jgi:hypothetical protein